MQVVLFEREGHPLTIRGNMCGGEPESVVVSLRAGNHEELTLHLADPEALIRLGQRLTAEGRRLLLDGIEREAPVILADGSPLVEIIPDNVVAG